MTGDPRKVSLFLGASSPENEGDDAQPKCRAKGKPYGPYKQQLQLEAERVPVGTADDTHLTGFNEGCNDQA